MKIQEKCDYKSEIVINGISGRYPKSSNLEEFWENLVQGVDMVGDAHERYNCDEFTVPHRLAVLKNGDRFDAEFFSMHAKQAAALDIRLGHLLEVSYEALLDGGIHPMEVFGSNTGVFVGACDSAAMGIISRSHTKDKFNMYALLGNVNSMLANRLSFTFNFHGPSYVVDTACSSSFVALQQAINSIRSGLCDAAIVASAVTQHDPTSSHCFHALKMTSPDGKCKSFDATADGYVRSECIVAMYICKRQVAKRCYGTLVHAVINCDGYTEQGITYPSEVRQEAMIRQVYEESGVDPLEVDYVEAHATGTRVGDPQEILAITNVFCRGRKGPLPIGSVKSNMGHPEPAAGLCQISKLVLAHLHGILPANLHYITPNPDIPALHDGRVEVIDKNRPFNAKYVGINSMGFGGTNVHVLLRLEQEEPIPKPWTPPIPILLLYSGRTKESIEYFLQKTMAHRSDQNFIRLTHEIAKFETHQHTYRGYVILNSQDPKEEIHVEEQSLGRQIWYIITGLGSQWAGMSRDLVRFDVFRKSIEKTSGILLAQQNFDLKTLLENGDPKNFEDFKNSVVSITAIQMALIDLLLTVGIEAHGIIGHSTGEVAAGYADGCLTQDQAALVSFARVRAVLESNLVPGNVASVGLTWEDAQKRCPPGIYPVIHNAEENVTVAGSPEVIQKFVADMESQGIFVKLVRSASFAFHSPLVFESGKLAKKFLEEIIPEPKLRSKKWLSSSVPEARWDSDLAKFCSPDYYVNNGINPVYFYPVLKHIPESAVVLEIGPHCFFQSILKKSLAGKSNVILGLIHVKSPDNCVYFLNSIAGCYVAGVNLNIAALYGDVQFPVYSKTPSLSSYILWDHSESHTIPHHSTELSRQKGIKFVYNLNNEMYSYLKGHSIDGKILFPASGYIWLAWRVFALQHSSKLENYPVVIENIRFERMTLMSLQRETELVVNVFGGSGKFEITEADTVVCSGTVRDVDTSIENEMFHYENPQENLEGPTLTREDFYKEMHLKGYRHSGLFQGVEEAQMAGQWTKVKWQGQWISFIDTLLQSFLLRYHGRDLYLPLRIQKLTFDPTEIKRALEENDGFVTVRSWETQCTGTCPGVEIRGLNFAKFNQKSRQLPQIISHQIFLPYIAKCVLREQEALEASIEIALDNCSDPKLIFTEIVQNPEHVIADQLYRASALTFPASEFYFVNQFKIEVDEDKISTSKILNSLEELKTLSALFSTDDEASALSSVNFLTPGGFLLFRANSPFNFEGLEMISEKRFLTEGGQEAEFYLMRKPQPVPQTFQIIQTHAEDFNWIETSKQTLKNGVDLDRVIFLAKNPFSGISGFFKCLIRESGGEKLRMYQTIEALEMDFLRPSLKLKGQFEKDLIFNIYKNHCWGSLCNVSVSKEEFDKKKPSTVAFANAIKLGDLSSLNWIESPLKLNSSELIEVHYSSLNFRDVMLASGKLVEDSLTEKYDTDCVLGMEFSGTYEGKRVCGLALSECLATKIDPKINRHIYEIPAHWSFEDAATVPCVYVTVYIALLLRGRLQPNESILIHAGSGGVGQAAIQIALSMKCRIFTTVSTKEKREFLKARFPELRDECFSNSRDAAEFENHILTQTRGKGVDMVLNSLAGAKLYASLRCLAVNGRFMEIGKFDIFNDSKIGLSILSKGVSVYGILADQFTKHARPEEVESCMAFMADGLRSGLIKPLHYHVFGHDQLEEAFRFMAQGKHIGKVLIKVRDNLEAPAQVPSLPRTYFPASKTYIIIGGLGGMGFELVHWMIKRGARKIILSSRSGQTTAYHRYHIGNWERKNVQIILDTSDTSSFEGAQALLLNCKRVGPIGGIFNTAVVLKDALFENQTQEDFQEVMKCKAEATKHLDALSRVMAPDLEYFVVFSSIIAARGNPGQTNYGFANSVMERICEARAAEGLPALAIQWGAVGDVGVFHRTMKDKPIFGLAPQSLSSCLETLDIFLQQKKTIVSSFVPFYMKKIAASLTDDSLVNVVANILGIKDIKRVNFKAPLVDLGLDSLMAAELSQVLQSRTSIQIQPKEYPTLTFEKLAEIDAKSASAAKSENSVENSPGQNVNLLLPLRPTPDTAVFPMTTQALSVTPSPFFIVHPIDGTMSTLKELVSGLDTVVYGIECVEAAPLDSVEALAGFYLNEIKKIQPQGPYKIGGYSFGGIVAFEMALQFERENQKVALLLELDGSPRWKTGLETLSSGVALSKDFENAMMMYFLSQYMKNVPPSIYKALLDEKTRDDKINLASKTLSEESPDFNFEQVRRMAEFFIKRAEIGRKYQARGKFRGKTVLVKGQQTKLGNEVPYDYGLSEVCEGAVDVVEVDGDHFCFFEKPLELGLPQILNKIIG